MNGILLDQGLAPRAAVLLRELGWDALHVAEIDFSRADDYQIIELARRERRVCVTFDHDFHSHLALTRADGPSVILIRAEGLDSAGQADLIQLVYDRCGDEIESGAAVSVDRTAIRVRKLPLR
jgi:predicted nuclease of predicted toxin-antitoxin system